jgi:hypothetical protein
MKKRTSFWFLLVLVLITSLVGVFALVQSYLNSDSFRRQLISECERKLGCKMQVKKISHGLRWRGSFRDRRFALLGGVDLFEVQLKRETQLPEFLKTETLQVRFDLYKALIQRKVVLEELKFTTAHLELDARVPLIALPPGVQPTPVAPPQGAILPSIPTIPGETSAMPDRPISSKPGPTVVHSPIPAPPSFDLPRLVVDDGSLALTLPSGGQIKLMGTHVKASFGSNPAPNAAGSVRCEITEFPPRFRLHDTKINFLWRPDSLIIPNLRANLFGGVIQGDLNIDAQNKKSLLQCKVSAEQLNAIDVMKLLPPQQGEVKGFISGKVHLQSPTLDAAQLSGEGQLKLQRGRLVNFPVLFLLGAMVGRPDFHDLELQKCEFDFLLHDTKLDIPRIEVTARDIQLTGSGWIKLIDQVQEFQLKLAVSQELAKNLPSGMIEDLHFRPDGYLEIPFSITGKVNRPKSDLSQRFESIGARVKGNAVFDKIFQSIPEKN